MNPHFGDFDTYHMAASAIDEAMRNAVAVGADPARIAILDNFCWGYTDRKETLGSLVRAAIACNDLALAFGTPFISGKDSLNNEFSYQDSDGKKQTIAIPPSLLISAMGQVDDVRHCVTMDLKSAGNSIYVIGQTKNELGGSHFNLVRKSDDSSELIGEVPKVDSAMAKRTFDAMHLAIRSGTVRACHDLSEGGLAAAATEMSMAGLLGMELDLAKITSDGIDATIALFSESNSRFLVEVKSGEDAKFEAFFAGLSCHRLGQVVDGPSVIVKLNSEIVLKDDWRTLKQIWQEPLNW
jgi:phosphoribosylformylglycinamidine synthase